MGRRLPHVGHLRWRLAVACILAMFGIVLNIAAAGWMHDGHGPTPLVHYKGRLVDVGDTTSQAVLTSPSVYDATPVTSNWQIAEAVTEWNRKSAFDARMTTSESTADVRVYEKTWQEVNAMCNYTGPGTVVGCRDGGLIWLNRDYRSAPMAEHVGGHELGHAFGHGHVTGFKSWMQPTVAPDNWLRAPTAYDYAVQQQLYGR